MFTSSARQNDSTYLLISQKLFKVQLQITNDLDTSKTVQTPAPLFSSHFSHSGFAFV